MKPASDNAERLPGQKDDSAESVEKCCQCAKEAGRSYGALVVRRRKPRFLSSDECLSAFHLV